jgi:hypothetical protein
MGHTWNVLFDENGNEIPFLGRDNGPSFPNKSGNVVAKVFRKTYAYQKESLFHIKENESVPDLFNTPFIKDVTDRYSNTVDVNIKLDNSYNTKFAYLAVFDNKNWVPIHWGKIGRGGKVIFKSMGRNCMYLPVVYKDGIIKPVGLPFVVNERAKIITISIEQQRKQKMVLHRKYPIKREIYIYNQRIIGGKFEASNFKDFRDSISIGTISRDPMMNWDTLRCTTNKKYRYWRFKGSKNGICNIAELSFYSNAKDITDTIKIIHNFKLSKTNNPINIFDKNKLTFIEIKQNTNEWVGMDFGKPTKIDYFKYLPRNDSNEIDPGNCYELFCWINSNWKSLAKCVSKSDNLIFGNVPAGGLYLLKNHTCGNEERIFTYENGKQVWW